MDLRCPKCNSTVLKQVSLAYQEGLYHVTLGLGSVASWLAAEG